MVLSQGMVDQAYAQAQQMGLDRIHEASARDEALVHIQQARGFANYLEGGKHHGGVTSEHHMDNLEAANCIREELDHVLQLLGLRA